MFLECLIENGLLLRVVVMSAAVAAVAFVFPTPSARAVEVDDFAVAPDQPVTKEYGPIATMDPKAAAEFVE